MLIRINLSELRPRLTEMIGEVRYGGQKVIIWRHGRPVAALMSMDDFARVWDELDDEAMGPAAPVTRNRPGPRWVRLTRWMRPRKLRPLPEEAGGALGEAAAREAEAAWRVVEGLPQRE
jgi:prevent-host-death family protein